jgi:hypothetical protein
MTGLHGLFLGRYGNGGWCRGITLAGVSIGSIVLSSGTQLDFRLVGFDSADIVECASRSEHNRKYLVLAEEGGHAMAAQLGSVKKMRQYFIRMDN